MTAETDRCWKCGYDLSKAAGEYVRCPECGEVNNRLTAARDRTVWRRERFQRLSAATVTGVAASLGGCVAGAMVSQLIVRDFVANSLAAFLGAWLACAASIWVVVRSVTPLQQRRARGRKTVVVAVSLGLVVTVVTLAAGMGLVWMMMNALMEAG